MHKNTCIELFIMQIHVYIAFSLHSWYSVWQGGDTVAYKGFTEAQAKAHKKYIDSKATIQIITTAEHREAIKTHAEHRKESMAGFILRAIRETMERDSAGQ